MAITFQVTNTLLFANEVGNTQKAKLDYSSLMPEINFDNPKSIELLIYLIRLGSNKNNDIILDFFLEGNASP